MSDTAFMKRVQGQAESELTDEDAARLYLLVRDGRAKVSPDGEVRRVPVSYGDGKKAPYGVTYADECLSDWF